MLTILDVILGKAFFFELVKCVEKKRFKNSYEKDCSRLYKFILMM